VKQELIKGLLRLAGSWSGTTQDFVESLAEEELELAWETLEQIANTPSGNSSLGVRGKDFWLLMESAARHMSLHKHAKRAILARKKVAPPW
jgi:hypothetical protein